MAKCNTADSVHGDICFAPDKNFLSGVRDYEHSIAKRDVVT